MDKKILSFDLDDTLYEEKQFVLSGYKAVSKHIGLISCCNEKIIYDIMVDIFNTEGREDLFNKVLELQGINTNYEVKNCLKIYRGHTPKIYLNKGLRKKLNKYKNESYLVTDGNRFVQRNKIKALNIENSFKKIFITRDYGVKNEKPSLKVFKIISKMEKIDLSSIVYIGDNPAKDFVNLNKHGALTIQVGNKTLSYGKEYNSKLKFRNIISAIEFLESRKII